MNKREILYMFAIMPPEKLAERIHTERMNFAEEYKAVKALKPPVHITLFDPFKIEDDAASLFEEHIAHLKHWANRVPSFEIELRDFSFFENPKSPVIYIDVVKSKQLNELQIEFKKQLKKYIPFENKNQPYRPHITIGYRDVDPKIFPQIKEVYSKKWFRETFECNDICLWRHDGQKWQTIQKYPLNGVQEQMALF